MKRAFDLVVGLMLLVLLAPLMLVVGLVVRLSLGSPVLWRQTRPGLGAVAFELLKFRTMSNEVDDDEKLLPDDRRLSAVGAFLRRTSLDELPELVNVLKGEMSLVGPRPLLMQYLVRYSAEQARRHEVRPGLTGWAQINGRNALTWEERFALDVWYVDHCTILLDLRILLLTIPGVLSRHGISAPGHATMSEFPGSRDSQVSPATRN